MGSRHRHPRLSGLALLGMLAVGPALAAAGAEASAARFAPAPASPDSLFAPPGGPDPAFALADPWTRWFDALEQSSGAEDPHLYPLDTPATPPAARPYRHLAIAKAVTQLERSRIGTGGPGREGHGSHGAEDESEPAAGRAPATSPLLALAQARNYLHLSEYEEALAWYGRADALDHEGHFRRETAREALAAAICAGDTVAAGRALAGAMGAMDLAGREAEFVLAMRWLLGRGDATTLSWFVDRAAAPEFAADVRVAFWRAYSLSRLERRQEALAELDRLLALGGRQAALGPRERGWVLTAWTDLTLLAGDLPAAEHRYRQLATSGTPALRDWGRLQTAALAFLGNRYGEAAAGFREICQAETKGAWTEHACAMADMAGRLERLLNEGERYGAAAHYGH